MYDIKKQRITAESGNEHILHKCVILDPEINTYQPTESVLPQDEEE